MLNIYTGESGEMEGENCTRKADGGTGRCASAKIVGVSAHGARTGKGLMIETGITMKGFVRI